MSHLVSQYDLASGAKDVTNSSKHHEESTQNQRTFLANVFKLTTVIQSMGNPFQDESGDLIALDTKDIAHATNAQMVFTHYQRGRDQVQEFLNGLANKDQFYQPIKKNRTDFFKQQAVSGDKKQRVLKEDCRLFSQLFISCQCRECDLQEFFRHENQPFPIVLSDHGLIHTCQKSHLVDSLEAEAVSLDMEPDADAIIIDGSALVHSLPPSTSETFDDYARLDFLPRIEAYSAKYNRTDVVFDVYLTSSLKAEMRSKRGRGVRRRVTGTSKTTRNWQSFLRDENNKTELFHFLAEKIAMANMVNVVIVTKGTEALSNQKINLDAIAPCTHEEADSRMFLHAKHAVVEGMKRVIVKANDTDVVVIAVSLFPSLQELGMQKMWVTFGQRSNLRWLSVHDIVDATGSKKHLFSPSYMLLVGVTLCLGSMVKERNPFGRHGMCALRCQMSLGGLASVHQQLPMKI